MTRTTASEMGLPPFRGAVRQIILASIAIYVVTLLLLSFGPRWGLLVVAVGSLDPLRVLRGWVWQLITYWFIYGSPIGFVFSVLFLFLLGGLGVVWIGSRRFCFLF